MDIFSHGLWGGIALGRRNKKSFIKAFVFGVAPDLLSFGFFFVLMLLGISQRPDFSVEPPSADLIPGYVHILYNITHSLIVFMLLFGVLFLVFRKPVWEFLAWGLHILIDIPTHSYEFFPTPFLWPVSDFTVDGRGWAAPEIFFPNVVLLLALYAWFFISKRKRIRANT